MIAALKKGYSMFLALLLIFTLVFSARAVNQPWDLVEVTSINPNIMVSLPYATKDNFCGQVLYPVERCFLRRQVAEALDKVQKDLEKQGYGLKIWDGYRPHSVQYKMWAIKPGTNYVANPDRGSRHNRGAAVDLTLVDFKTKQDVKMPTDYDVFSFRAHAWFSNLPKDVLENKQRLQKAMTSHGFKIMSSEWWHFDYDGWWHYHLMNTPLDQLAKEADLMKEQLELEAKEKAAAEALEKPLSEEAIPESPAPVSE